MTIGGRVTVVLITGLDVNRALLPAINCMHLFAYRTGRGKLEDAGAGHDNQM